MPSRLKAENLDVKSKNKCLRNSEDRVLSFKTNVLRKGALLSPWVSRPDIVPVRLLTAIFDHRLQ